jgi:hypothetical protein
MPYRMSRAGRFFWPHGPHWMGFWPPDFHFPCWPPFYPLSGKQEEAMLSEQAEILEEELQRIQQRLKELRKVKEEKKDAKSV